MRVPPGVTASDFAAAIKQFQAIVGADWVFTSDEDLNTYRDFYSPLRGEPTERVASAAVAPTTVEEVQAILKVANQYSIPIYTISTGRNLGYGGSAPSYSGSVVLDLKRMNRILEVNVPNAYVLVEPGVSYFDLYRYFQDKGIKLWVDCPDPGWGGLIGNALERGSGYMLPGIRNHFQAHCGMEVVLANGEVMRTGMGALPNAKTWQEYKTGFGPFIDGVFSQSNFGVVTKMGFWMMPEPDAYLKGKILLPRYKDLPAFVEILNYLENTRVFNGTPDFGSPLLVNPLIADWPEMLQGDGPQISPEHLALLKNLKLGYSPELEEYGLKNKIGYWECSLTFYGPAKAIWEQWEYAKEKCRAIPDVAFEDGEVYKTPFTPEQIEKIHLPEIGIPSLQNFVFGARSKLNPNPTHGHLWFAPIIPRNGEAIYEINKLFAEVAEDMGVPIQFSFALPACYWERSFIVINGFSVTEDVKQNQKTMAMYTELVKRCAAKGWAEYRSTTLFHDEIMSEYSFNNHALLRFHETVKDAVDPKGILSAGHYGIWPKHLRGARK